MWVLIPSSGPHWLILPELRPLSHSVTLKLPHQGESERDDTDPAWAVQWDPVGQVRVLRGLPSEVPLWARPSFLLPFLSSFLSLPSCLAQCLVPCQAQDTELEGSVPQPVRSHWGDNHVNIPSPAVCRALVPRVPNVGDK